MILLHTIKDDEFFLNSFHIEKIESRPDTVITLTNEKKFVVRESPIEIISLIADFQKKIKVLTSFDQDNAKSEN
jgi:flagellar protein FlbD